MGTANTVSHMSKAPERGRPDRVAIRENPPPPLAVATVGRRIEDSSANSPVLTKLEFSRKEIVLNTTSRTLTLCLAAFAAMHSGSAHAAMHLAIATELSASAVAQQALDDDAPEVQRLKVADLLKRARTAMQEGDWSTAETLTSRAEAFNVSFPLMYFGDTPKKVRRDLDRVRPAGAMPSERFTAPKIDEQPAVAARPNTPSAEAAPAAPPVKKNGVPGAGSPNIGSANSGAANIGTTTTGDITLADGRVQSRSYLTKGRAELARGNITGASHWCEKAMQLGAEFGAEEDSPEKLVLDIQRAGGKVANGKTANGNLANSDGRTTGNGAFPEQSPFAQPAARTPPATGGDTPSLLTRESWPGNTPSTLAPPGAHPLQPATPQLLAGPPAAQPVNPAAAAAPISAAAPMSAAAPTVAAGTDDQRRAQSDGMLWAARRALAVGDVRRAGEALAQAKELGVRYEFHEDSPAKVEAAISRYADLVQLKDKDSDAYRRRYADLQMQQAEDLLRWRDFDEAERLATEAKRRGVAYTPFENNPDAMLKRIAEARKTGNVAVAANSPSGAPAQAPRLSAAMPAAAAPIAPPGSVMPSAAPPTTATSADIAQKKAQALELVKQSRAALASNDLAKAEALARQAESLGVPDDAFASQDDRAWLVMFQIQKARRATTRTPSAAQATDQVQPAQAILPADASAAQSQAAKLAIYEPQNDPTHNVPASAQAPVAQSPAASNPNPSRAGQPTTSPAATPAATTWVDNGQSVGVALFLQGEEALRRHDVKTAQALFKEAANHRQDLDVDMQQRLQDRLQIVAQGPAILPAPGESGLMKEAAGQEQLKVRRANDEVNRQIAVARKLQESDPKQAAAVLEQARRFVETASLDTPTTDMLLRRVDRNVDELQKYVDSNKARIALDERNRTVKDEIDRDMQVKVEVQEKIAKMVDEFNELMDQRRYAEAELLAKKAFELAPREPVVNQIRRQAAFTRATQNAQEIEILKRDGVVRMEEAIEMSAIPWDDTGKSMQFGKEWNDINKRRKEWYANNKGYKRSEREIEIEQRLKTPVSLQFKDAPLEEVMRHLAKLANVSIYLDPRGLAEEAVDTSTPITIDLTHEISLKSALSLILEPLHLSYVIKDEVLKITSEQLRDGEVYPVTYNVADLVIPIPNFMPNGNMGLSGALRDAQAALNPGGPLGAGNSPLAAMASPNGSDANAMVDPKILAQFGAGGGGITGFGGMGRGGGATGVPQNIPFGGPGGMGGGVQPDFESLIELITATIAPTTWSDVGGAGAVKQFAGNLSLVVSQTQEVHEQISDLLEQLRRLQDLQVTIEVRFISLSDTFYEKMGVQFDMNNGSNVSNSQAASSFNLTQSGVSKNPLTGTSINGTSPTASFSSNNAVTVGVASPQNPVSGFPAGQLPNFSNDLEIPFLQNSFSQTLPTQRLFNYTGVGASGGATLGFAILSNLEAYFFMEAVQNDIRTNILQAPKVTLFNGQQAFVSDTTQSPFVISVIPVVGDFAAAQQPVIVVLSEGTFLTVQAVVSSDRRFVRLTVVPFFSQIGNVNTFTFTGSSSNTRTSSADGPEGATTSRNNSASASAEATTVQLPQFAFQTVTTTVSVPDGGTVLLGGIKRLTEERKEDGVPILNKLPYVNRLFNNISTGRVTSSLMMMVTPRIIIQEEEEALLGVMPNSP
jgi:general secretion pathway protein D